MNSRRASVQDVHEFALAMPHVTVLYGPKENPIYQVGGRSFVFFRTPRPDAADPRTGQRYPDVIMFWVGSEDDKLALVQDESSPFFTHQPLRRPSLGADPGGASRSVDACRTA